MSDTNAGGAVEKPTVEELTAQLTEAQNAKEAAETARTKAEAKIVEMKKAPTKTNDGLSEEEVKTKELLKGMGFATNEELEDFKKFKTDTLSKEQKANEDKEFNDFASGFNTLSDQQKGIIRDLKKVHTDKTYDEILKDTNFINEAQLSQYKKGGIMGGENIGLPAKKEEVTISTKVKSRMNFKSADDLSNIRSKFGI